jgi:hypothetical protein
MTRPGKAKLATLNQLDGRTAAARQARDLIADLESDLGGSDVVSTAEKQIIQRAAITSALLESMAAEWLATGQMDAAMWATLSNLERRLYETLGLERRAKPVESLQEYLEKKKNNEASE